MLKIDENNLSFKEKESRWSPHLLLALTIALAFHLFFYLMFPVRPIALEQSSQILPPITVFADRPHTAVRVETFQPKPTIPPYLTTHYEPDPTLSFSTFHPTPPSSFTLSLPIPKLTPPPSQKKVFISALEETVILKEPLALDLPNEDKYWTIDFGYDADIEEFLWFAPRSPIPSTLWTLADKLTLSPSQGILRGTLIVEVK